MIKDKRFCFRGW